MDSRAVCHLRALARDGVLAATVLEAGPAQHRVLTGAAYELAWPVVFRRVTRPVERRRGHPRCATGLTRLAAECADRFHDDVEAVVTDLLRYARVPIHDVEAWVAARVVAATVDGHRRRRGERGALQRPRVPGWLTAELGRDPWLVELAGHMLDWVGVPDTAGAETWPVGSWAALSGRSVGDDVSRVLAAMKHRPRWYDRYVERPLGAKRTPVAAPPGDGPKDPRPLPAETLAEADERRLAELAAEAVAAIAAGLSRGDDPRETVLRVLGTVFGAGTGSDEMDRAPGGAAVFDRLVSARLADPQVVDRIVKVITG